MQTTVRKDTRDIPVIRDQAEELKEEIRTHGTLQCRGI